MLQLLGTTRVIILTALVVLISGISALLYYYLLPLRERTDRELATAKSEVAQKRTEIAALKEEYETLQSQLVEFKFLEKKGFFNNQNRVLARDRLELLSKITGLPKSVFDIAAGETLTNDIIKPSGHVVIRTPIKITINTFNDTDVYTFVSLLEERFPGEIGFQKITVNRSEEVTSETLKKIGSGENVNLVSSDVVMTWYSMWPEDKLNEQGF